MDLNNKRLLVISGAALIGAHPVDALLAEPVAEIRSYDQIARRYEEVRLHAA